jgi:chromosomal replication initiation ATPase DnaA
MDAPWRDDPKYGGMSDHAAEASWSAERNRVVPLRAASSPRIKFVRTSTNDIMATAYDPIKWVVPGYISEGFLVLAGRQKLGKTWLACALGQAACRQGFAVFYTRFSRLLEELRIAHGDGSFSRRLQQLARTDLLILRVDLVRRQRVEHERIVRVRAVSQCNFSLFHKSIP